MKVVYNCHIPEVMGYPECGYCFRHGEDAFLMWKGYFDDLMYGMWHIYGWVPDPAEPGAPNLDQVPLLREWNEGRIGVDVPLPIDELRATSKAIRDAVAELRRAGPKLAESVQHGEALAAFLEQAVSSGQSVTVEKWWG